MDPFIGEIRMFCGNFAPRGWALCNGQLLPISQNAALFSILGTTYGGNGTTTFGLPNLQGRAPIHWGASPGGSTYVIGEQVGAESVTLISTQIPAHTHTVNPPVSNAGGNATDPTGGMPAMVNTGTPRAPVTTAMGYTTGASTGTGAASNTGPAGGSQPHENRPPSLAVTFIIALTGIFPSRN